MHWPSPTTASLACPPRSTTDEAQAQRFARELECGGVFLNGYCASDARAFGGVKKSGFGRSCRILACTSSVMRRPSGKTVAINVSLTTVVHVYSPTEFDGGQEPRVATVINAC